MRAEVARLFGLDPYRMKKYPVKEERRMIAYFLKVSGRLDKSLKDGEYTVEKSGDVNEDDPSITLR